MAQKLMKGNKEAGEGLYKLYKSKPEVVEKMGYTMQMGVKEIDSPGAFSTKQSKIMQMSPLRMTDPVKVEQADPSAWVSTGIKSSSELGTGPGGIPTITTTNVEDFQRGSEGSEPKTERRRTQASLDFEAKCYNPDGSRKRGVPGCVWADEQGTEAPSDYEDVVIPGSEGNLETKQETTTDTITAPSRDVYTNFEARQAQRNVGQAFRKAKRATIREERGALRSKLKGSDMTREERKAERKKFRDRKRDIKASAKKYTAQGKRAVAQDVLNQVLGGKSAGSQSRFVSGTDKEGKKFQEQELVTLMKPMQFRKNYKK